MGVLDWLLLLLVIVLGVAACIFVARLKKSGHPVPGKMCAGCNDLHSLGMQFPSQPSAETENQKPMQQSEEKNSVV